MGVVTCPLPGHGPSVLHASQAVSHRAISVHPCTIARKPLRRSESSSRSREKQQLSGPGNPLRKPARRCLHVAPAGGPSGGLQKTKRVGGGQVSTTAVSGIFHRCVSGTYLTAAVDSLLSLLLLWPCHCCTNTTFSVQVDTPIRKLLLGIAVAYTVLIVVVPFLNVFYQVRMAPCQCRASFVCALTLVAFLLARGSIRQAGVHVSGLWQRFWAISGTSSCGR